METTHTSTDSYEDQVQRVLEMLRAIARNCDGAHEQDGAGFNKFDAEFGRSLAGQSTLTLKQMKHAIRMITFYRRQLAHFGDFTQWASDLSATVNKLLANPPKDKAQPIRITDDGVHYTAYTPYGESWLMPKIKSLPIRTYVQASKGWTFPHNSISDAIVRAACDKFEIVVEQITPPVSITFNEQGQDPTAYVVLNTNLTPYDPTLSPAARVVGGEWDSTLKHYTFPSAANPEGLLALIARFQYRADPAVITHLSHLAEKQKERRAASGALDADIEVPRLALELRPYQRGGVAFLDSVIPPSGGGGLIGDEMGLGKTVQAIAFAQLRDAFPVLIVCPSVVKINWAREFAKFVTKKLNVYIITGRRPTIVPDNAHVVIINYDILADHARAIDMVSWGTVVFDEIHYVRNLTTKRTKACLSVALEARRKGAACIGLSGTPLVNKPSELSAQLDVLGVLPTFARSHAEFARKFWDKWNKAPRNVALLHELLTQIMVRREKRDVLTELPPVLPADMYVDVDPKFLAEYKKAEADVIEYVRQKELLRRVGEGESLIGAERSAAIAAERASRAEILARITRCRELAALAKLDSAAQAIQQLDGKVLVFAHHKSVIDGLVAKLGAPKIDGGVSAQKRMRIQDEFQAGEHKVLVLAINAAGVGINLTAATEVVFLELPWTSMAMEQARDRAHRIGQTRQVTVWTALSEMTPIDLDMAELIAGKALIAQQILNGRTELDEGSMAEALVQRVLLRHGGAVHEIEESVSADLWGATN